MAASCNFDYYLPSVCCVHTFQIVGRAGRRKQKKKMFRAVSAFSNTASSDFTTGQIHVSPKEKRTSEKLLYLESVRNNYQGSSS